MHTYIHTYVHHCHLHVSPTSVRHPPPSVTARDTDLVCILWPLDSFDPTFYSLRGK
ncbi:hypothetical protein B0H17DRAFT_1065994 [Mycena rosella]|uniref:Uncharacterized protein n=1 Tax=Mycena rosella TaxID=1033263 RepID=A0AAD7GIR5_MYCRO|nr:hypothetical protein B0H17DRAFT_1065994 [Mycena rosella]